MKNWLKPHSIPRARTNAQLEVSCYHGCHHSGVIYSTDLKQSNLNWIQGLYHDIAEFLNLIGRKA